jgi:hypothetical protein
VWLRGQFLADCSNGCRISRGLASGFDSCGTPGSCFNERPLPRRSDASGERVAARAKMMQQKSGQPVQFEATNPTRLAVEAWIATAQRKPGDSLFPSAVP